MVGKLLSVESKTIILKIDIKPVKPTEKAGELKNKKSVLPYEDRGMKYAGAHFGNELMSYVGLDRPIRMAPTEIIELEMKQMYEDFNYEMQDGSWIHFEFQSSDGKIEDLRRFRQYEANASSTHGVAVTTYVVYTGNVTNPMTSFTEGINTYRVIPILMGDRDGDQVIGDVREKLLQGQPLTKQDLLPLVLTPLMSGKDTVGKRIKTVFELLREAEHQSGGDLDKEELKKLESIEYAFANKFLNYEELKEVEEVLSMTTLGQMLFENGMKEGMAKGRAEGMEKSVVKIVTTMISKNKTVEEIHDDTEIPITYIQKIKDSLS